MAHRAVFFDFGGTLFSYGAIREHFDALLERIARRHGVEADSEQLRSVYRGAMARSFIEFQSRPFYLHRDLFRHAYERFLVELAAEVPSKVGDAFYEAQSDLGMDRVAPRPEVPETLAALRENGLHLSIVSNIDDDQFHPLFEQLGLAPLFDATTTSEEARSCKPDPGIFRTALSKAGDPPPAEVVFVGDSQQHDVAGAAPFGMTTVLLSRRPPSDAPAPDHVIQDLRELLGIVRV